MNLCLNYNLLNTMLRTFTEEQQYKIYFDYVTTVIECNYVSIRHFIEIQYYPNGSIDWKNSVISERLMRNMTKHSIMTFKEFIENPSLQCGGEYKKIDEWYWKFSNRLIKYDNTLINQS